MLLSLQPPSAHGHRIVDEAIAEHETSISKLEASIAELRSKILELKTRRNTYCTISKLPTELFTTIMLDETQPSQHSNCIGFDMRNRISFAAVCRKWRAVVLNTPRLWASIDVTSLRPDACLKMLHRSKSAPLHIRYELGDYDLAVIKRYNAAANAIMKRVGRIQTLDIPAQSQALRQFLRRHAGATATSLQVLRLGSQRYDIFLNKALIQLEMPSLRTLTLRDGMIGDDFPSLPSVTALNLHRYHLEEEQALAPFLGFLQNMPNLETLSLHVQLLDPDLSAHRSTFARIALPRLFFLDLTFSYASHFEIFDYLPRPTSTVIRFEQEVLGNPEHTDLTGLINTFSHLADGNVVPTIDVSVTTTENVGLEFVLDVSPPGVPLVEHFNVQFPSYDSSSVGMVMQLSEVLPLAAAHSLTMNGFIGRGEEEEVEEEEMVITVDWPRFFRLFQGVHLVDFCLCNQHILKGLRRSAEYLPLPELQAIHFHSIPYDLEDMAELRFLLKEILDQHQHSGIAIEVYRDGVSITDIDEQSFG